MSYGCDMPVRPAGIGHVDFLVYVECMCGYYCGMPEGGPFPICPNDGRRCVPGGAGQARWGEDAAQSRRMRSLAYVTFLTSETGALELIGRVKRFLGLSTEEVGPVAAMHQAESREGRLLREDEIAALLEVRGFPTEPQWAPSP